MNWKKVGLIVAAAMAFLGGVHEAMGLENAFPLDVILMIYLPCILVALYLQLRQIDAWPAVLQSTGISIGIFVSILWFMYLLQYISDPNQLFSGMSRSFTAILHGGVISAVGYFLTSDDQPQSKIRNKGDYAVLMAIAVSVPAFEVLYSSTEPAAYLDMTSLLVFCAPLLLLFALGIERIHSAKFLRAVVVGMLGAALLSMVAYTAGADDPKAIGPASALGMLGLLYGAFCLFVFGCVMPSNPSNRKVLWRANWHALEIYALVILIIFPPPSILDSFV